MTGCSSSKPGLRIHRQAFNAACFLSHMNALRRALYLDDMIVPREFPHHETHVCACLRWVYNEPGQYELFPGTLTQAWMQKKGFWGFRVLGPWQHKLLPGIEVGTLAEGFGGLGVLEFRLLWLSFFLGLWDD